MMKYDNSNIRRQDRILEESAAINLLSIGEYGVLSMYSNESGIYSIPLNYVWDTKSSLYIHCASEGRKLNIIDKNNSVSFCIVGKTNVISNKFTTEYESLVLECKAYRNLSTTERMNALIMILEKYSPNDKITGLKYAEISFHRTEIIRLDINKWSGKCKKIKTS